MTDDLEWATPLDDPSRPERPPKSCRHQWRLQDADLVLGPVWACSRCYRIKDEAASRRGRTSLRAGKDAERAIAKAYPGAIRTGHLGGRDDVLIGELFIVQSKAGGWFSNRVWDELEKLRGSTRIPTLIVSDRPGPGHKTRRYVVRSLEDDVALHGEKP